MIEKYIERQAEYMEQNKLYEPIKRSKNNWLPFAMLALTIGLIWFYFFK